MALFYSCIIDIPGVEADPEFPLANGLTENLMNALNQMERDQRLNRIRRIAGIMRWVVTAILVLVLAVGVLLALFLALPDAYLIAPAETIDFGEFERAVGEIPYLQRVGILGLGFVWVGLLFSGVLQIRRIFVSFHRSDFFSPAAFNPMVSFGTVLILLGVFEMVSTVAGSVLMTLDLPAGQRQIALSLDGGEIFYAVLGILVVLFGWTMREASVIAEENRQFV
jgi:magnesium-transporting ATPase (P-type)